MQDLSWITDKAVTVHTFVHMMLLHRLTLMTYFYQKQAAKKLKTGPAEAKLYSESGG